MDSETLRVLILFGSLFVGAPAAVILSLTIGKALSTRIAGRPLPEEEDVKALKEAYEEAARRVKHYEQRLVTTTERLLDVEERLDFMERMLSQRAPAREIEPGD